MKTQLSQEQQAEVERKRAIFRQLHDVFSDSSSLDTEIDLQMIANSIESAFLHLQKTTLVKDLEDLDFKDDKLKEVIGELSTEDALAFLMALRNAISHHLREKNKTVLVKELEIKLL